MALLDKLDIPIEPPATIDWNETKNALCAPVGLGRLERLQIWLRGRRDARQGIAHINEDGTITSPFIETIIQETNIGIIDEWRRCDERAFEIRAQLLGLEKRRQALQHQLRAVVNTREEELARAKSGQFAGDTVVSDYLVAKRQNRRETLILKRYEAEEDSLRNEIEKLDAQAIVPREQLKELESIALSHEQIQHKLFLWKLSAYAYGASRFLTVKPGAVNDQALTTKPAQNHFERFQNELGYSNGLAGNNKAGV